MPTRTEAFDDAKMHAFGDRLVRDTAAMLLGNLAYIGDQLGLFKILAQSGPVTLDQLADLAACNARYIREWLSAMAAAGWLEYEAAAGRFTLPPEHVPFLADENHPIDPQGLIKDIRRALRPEGTYLLLAVNASSTLEHNLHPLGAFFYAMSTLYCMTVSLAHGGAGIGICMGEELPREMCAEAGFSHFRTLDFTHPFAVLYEVRIAG